jgi:hypothetical protein
MRTAIRSIPNLKIKAIWHKSVNAYLVQFITVEITRLAYFYKISKWPELEIFQTFFGTTYLLKIFCITICLVTYILGIGKDIIFPYIE